MKRLLSKILVFFMAANTLATPSYAITKEPCQLLMSDWHQDKDSDKKPFKGLLYKVFTTKEKKKKEGDRVRSNRYLGKDDFAIGFNRDGSLKLYYGGKEALFDRADELSFQITPVDHNMELRDHDVFVIYRSPYGGVREKIQAMFEVNPDNATLSPGYNCVDMTCQLLELGDGSEFETRIFQPEELFRALLWKSYYTGDIEILVSDDIKNPKNFYDMLYGLKKKDGFSLIDETAEFTLAIGVMLSGVSVGFVGLWHFLDWLYSY